MTKKDFVKFAELIRKYKNNSQLAITYMEDNKQLVETANALYRILLDGTIEIFEADNPRFDKQRFIDHINKFSKETDK